MHPLFTLIALIFSSLSKCIWDIIYFFHSKLFLFTNFTIFDLKEIPSFSESEDFKWCIITLNKTSRSFAAVTQQLPKELKCAVSLFYLILRALDTIEDDFDCNIHTKKKLLQEFSCHLKIQNSISPDYNKFKNCGELLKNFQKVIKCFQSLSPDFQEIIRDSAHEMGFGMSSFLQKPIQSTVEWERYCHFVAGLVGQGLSKMWVASGLESRDKFISPEFQEKSNSMGLFLQKVNIIRDCKEDADQQRRFLPQEIWGKYVKEYGQLFQHEYKNEALQCLNEFVTDATKHIPHCLEYLREITNFNIFRFCAIPQVMAIATLTLCYNNYDVFLKKVKISRVETYSIISNATDYDAVLKQFAVYSEKMMGKALASNSNSDILQARLAQNNL